MKLSNILTAISTCALVGILTFTVFADSTANKTAINRPEPNENMPEFSKMQPMIPNELWDEIQEALPDDLKAKIQETLPDRSKADIKEMLPDDLKAEMQERQNKLNALTDAQKEEIYSLKDRNFEIEKQIIDKYLEFGLLTQEEATEMKDGINKSQAAMRENNVLPIYGKSFHRSFLPNDK